MKTPMTPSRQRMLCHLVILSFFVLLWAPCLQMFLHVAPEVSLDENRRLVQLPTLKMLSFDDTEFQKAFEGYYTDHFGFRNTLIFCNNYIKASQFNVSPSPYVSIGKNGWYYFDLPSQGMVFKDYMGLVRYDSAKLARLADNLDMIHTKLEKAGIPLLLVVAPDKQTIYPEYMSDSMPKRRSRTRLDQVLEYLHEKKPHLLIVNPRVDIIRAKSTFSQALYYKTDTHWNKYGAFVAYRKMMEVMSGLVPVTKALALDDYSITHKVKPDGDIVKMISMEGRSSDDDWVFELKKPVTLNVFYPGYEEPNSLASLGFWQKNKALPHLLMYCDSFAVSLIPLLAPHFSRSVFVWSNIIDSAHISAEKPDIVVLEIIERNLDILLEEKDIFRR